MTTLNELQFFIERSEAEARSQDKMVDHFYEYLGELGSDISLSFSIDALPEPALNRCLATSRVSSSLIRG